VAFRYEAIPVRYCDVASLNPEQEITAAMIQIALLDQAAVHPNLDFVAAAQFELTASPDPSTFCLTQLASVGPKRAAREALFQHKAAVFPVLKHGHYWLILAVNLPELLKPEGFFFVDSRGTQLPTRVDPT
jgi:hypothetical protein